MNDLLIIAGIIALLIIGALLGLFFTGKFQGLVAALKHANLVTKLEIENRGLREENALIRKQNIQLEERNKLLQEQVTSLENIRKEMRIANERKSDGIKARDFLLLETKKAMKKLEKDMVDVYSETEEFKQNIGDFLETLPGVDKSALKKLLRI